ncbi:MAG: PAS domain S-box protein [Candidatus Promineifilaceae bacterium]
MGHKTQNQPPDPASPTLTTDVHTALYQSLLHSPTLGFWVLDKNGRFLETNDAYLHRSGYTRQEMLGLHVHDIEEQATSTETATHLKNIIAQGHLLFETLHRAKNGEIWPVEISASYADGRFFAIIQDITHRKKVESELRQKSKALENSINGFDIVSAEGKFIYANRAYLAMWGYDSVEEIIGTSPAAHCADPELPSQIIQNLEAHDAYTLMFTAKRKDGSTFEVMMVTQKMVDDEGTVTYIGTSLDITALLQAQQSLHTEHTHLRSLLDTIPDLVWLKDTNGIYLACNPAFERLVGIPEAELLGKTDYDLFAPDTARFFRTHDQNALIAGGSTANEEWLTFARDGRTILAETIKTPIRDEDGQVLGVLGIARDVTERKEAEHALRDSEERLELALKGADLGLWDWKSPNQVTFNERWAEMLGYTLAALEPHASVWEKLIHPNDLPGVIETLQAHMDGRTNTYEAIYRLQTQSGAWRWIQARGRVLKRDEAGNPLRMVGTHLDITEQKLAEEALRESEERLQLFIDHAPAALAMFNREMCYLAVSHRWLADYELEKQEILGRSHYDIFPEIPDRWKTIHQRGLAGEIIQADEDPFVRLDGHTQWLRWEVRPWYTSSNEVGGIVVFSEDITERKEAETAVKQMQAVLTQAETIAKIGSWQWDLTTQALTWSDEMYHLFGVNPHDNDLDLNQIVQERIHPDDAAAVQQANASVLKSHKPEPMEYRVVLPDGTERIILAEGRLIWDEAGQPTALVGYAQDITERKHAEQAIRDSEERYHSTLENMLEGCQIIGFDWRYLYVNPSVAEHGRTTAANLLGKTMMEAYPGIETTDLFAVLSHCMTNRTPHLMENKFEYEDGSYAWFDLRIQPVPEGLFILSIDITERKAAVEALRQSEERFSKAFHLSPAALSLTRSDGTILDVNESYERLSGYSRNELINQDPTRLNIFTQAQRANLRQKMAAAGNRLSEAEITIRTKLGGMRHVLYSVEAVDIKDEPCALTLAFDITERKQMEMTLQEMANNMATAQAMTHSGSWEVHLTADFELLEPHIWSDECFRIFGLKPGSAPVTGERFYAMVHPEDREGVRKVVEHHLQTDGQVEYEYRLIRPDGTIRTVLDRVMLVKDEQTDRPVKLVGFVQDITESKKAEETIAQLNQRMELILNSAGEGIYGADSNGRITFINPAMAHILGREPAQLHGQEAHSMFHYAYPDGSPYPATECQNKTAVLDGKELHNQPDIFWHKNGNPIFVEYTTTPIYHTGQVIGSVTMVRDVTQSKKAAEEQAILEEQLRQAQKMESIGRLAGGVAHDFNNQLAVIKLYGDLMRHGMNNHDPLLPKLEQIRQAVDRSADLTRQLLAFSRKQVLQPVLLNLNNLITNLEKMLGRLLGEDIALSSSLQPNLWPVMADPGQMEQVIMNLMINARDAMPTGGMITLETHNVHTVEPTIHPHRDMLEGPCVLLAITDNGHGMDDATSKQIFEPFFTTKHPGKGTGLGLATVHGIIKQSGGTIYVYSEPAQGTTFKIYLPAQEPSAQQTAVSIPGAAQTGSETILLVEDEPALCELIQETLQEIGYTVLASQNGDDALAIAHTYPTPIELLLTDVVLPHRSGQEVAKELTAVSPQTKVLFISGYTDDAVIRHGVLTANVNFLSKPFSRSALAAKVREVLDK